MKKILLLSLALTTCLFSFSQQRVTVKKSQKLKSVKAYHKTAIDDQIVEKPVNYSTAVKGVVDVNETQIGDTYYDLWTNCSMANRIYLYDDGTIGAVWTRGVEASSFPDRGTGYNYFDGTSWGPMPTARIETMRTGWPSYAPWGVNGELIVSHGPSDGLLLATRATKGAGNWTEAFIPNPEGSSGLTWPRTVTAGADHNIIHNLANSYDPYLGQPQALCYSRSTDGGATWDIENEVIEGLGPDYFHDIGGDDYAWAEPQGDTIAFLIASKWHDMVLMKSLDGGDNWTKTVIYEFPIPLWYFGADQDSLDTTFVCDGSAAICLDKDGMVHVAFGIVRVMVTDPSAGSYTYFPYCDGIGYWNENMPTWTDGDQYHALDPDVLYESGNIIGWTQDVDSNGSVDFLDDGIVSYRGSGISTMPNLIADDNGFIFLSYASTTEGFDDGTHNYKHIWLRGYNGYQWGDFLDIDNGIAHMFHECVYPNLAQNSDADNIYLIYQADEFPGLALNGDHDYVNNFIYNVKVPKADLVTTANENPDINVTPTSLTINQSGKGSKTNNNALLPCDKTLKPVLTEYVLDTIIDENGNIIYGIVVPGIPPDHFEPVASPSRSSVMLSNIPAFNWCFGCSATSAAMEAGYYDNNGYPDMYTGPINGGVCPLDNSAWPDVVINGENRHQCPLSATHNGLDGRTTRGHVDDYWIIYGDPGPDPWITNSWTEHTWEDCTADFMGTNQSTYESSDGSTWFYYNGNGSPLHNYTGCQPDHIDGCHGMRDFFESRGYTVLDNYTQLIYGYNGNTQGFTLTDYRLEIDAGRPVLIQVSGHTMLGVGYETGSSDIIYLHDTWDYSIHSMNWGGSYSGMQHYAMTVVELDTTSTSNDNFTIENIGTDNLSINSISDNKNWLTTSGYPSTPFTIIPNSSQQVTVTVDWNLMGSGTETGIITINSDDPDEPTVTVTVTAISLTNTLSVSPSNRNVNSNAGTTTFSITSNTIWTVSDDAGWLTVSPDTANNNGTLTATFIENTNSSQRIGTITVSGTGVSSVNVTVTQAANPGNNHFIPIWTGNPYQPMNILVSTATLDGVDLNVGDEIGIFDVDGTGNEICVGMSTDTQAITPENPLSIIASTDDPSTTDIDGFTSGDTIIYKAWSSSTQTEYSTYQATYNAGFDNVFTPLGTALVDVAFLSYVTQTIELNQGWNIISFYVAPDNMNLLDILQPLVTSNELLKVIDEAGGFIQNIPGVSWMNTIGDLANTEGYYMKVTANTSFDATGIPVSLPLTIPLNTGWNIMGYPTDQSQDAITVLQPLIDANELTKVINESGGFIQNIPGVGWMNTIGNFDADKGYYIKVNTNTSLTIGGTTPTWQCGDPLEDTRDGQTYNTVLIGDQCWMAENLNVGTRIDGVDEQTDNSIIEKYCYDDDVANCDTYGGLYQWDEMMQYVTTEGVQGICPDGWHIPTDDEWKTMEMELGMTQSEADGTGYRGTDEGYKLKSTNGWQNNGNGSDEYGFEALPGGYRNFTGFFFSIEKGANFWSSTESGAGAWLRGLNYLSDEVFRSYYYKSDGFSVRCVQD